MTLTLLALPVVLLLLGLPVFLVLLGAAAATLFLVLPIPVPALHQVLFGGLDNYALLAVPFFVLAGELMGRGGIAQRLIDWVLALSGRMPGSLGVATVGASAMLGAISGSSVAAVASLGRTLFPRLEAAGYGRGRSAGLIAASGAIDIVIPPSIALILYGLAAEQSIPRLFLAGLLPGLLLALMMAGAVIVIALRAGIPRSGGFDAVTAWRTTRAAFWGLLMPVLVLGGIYAGWFSPTEAGGVASLYAMLVARFVYRSMGWGAILQAAADAAILSAKILVIVAAAGLVTWILTSQGVPQAITAWMQSLALAPWAFLIGVNLVLLLIGCILDPTSAILVLAPLLVPMAVALGIDPIHFCVVMTVNLAIGMFTPPFGLNLFVAQTVTGVAAHRLYLGVLPFVAVQVAALLLVTYLPALSLLLGRAI